jgi:hypothetical protein
VVTLTLTPDTLGTVPATVTIPANQMAATFHFTAAAVSGEGTLTATLGAQSIPAAIVVTAAPTNTTDHMVISEFASKNFAADGTTVVHDDEFIELYNPTNQDIDLTGWQVQYKSATGPTFGTIATLSGTIKARGYFLVAHDNFTGPTADVTYSSATSHSGGNIRLGNDQMGTDPLKNTGVVDKLAWGTGNTPEGTAALAISNANAANTYERKANAASTNVSMADPAADGLKGNEYDSDDNSVDFVIRATRDPQNASSPTEQP